MRPDRILLFLALMAASLVATSATADPMHDSTPYAEVSATAPVETVTTDITETIAVALPFGLDIDAGSVALLDLGQFDANAPDDVGHALILTLLGANDAHRYLLESDAPLTLDEPRPATASLDYRDTVNAPAGEAVRSPLNDYPRRR